MSTAASTLSRVPSNLRLRRTFGRIKKIIDIPNLIEIQKRSYEEFLQKDLAPEQRKDQGLKLAILPRHPTVAGGLAIPANQRTMSAQTVWGRA